MTFFCSCARYYNLPRLFIFFAATSVHFLFSLPNAYGDTFLTEVIPIEFSTECDNYKKNGELLDYISDDKGYAAVTVTLEGLEKHNFQTPGFWDNFLNIHVGTKAKTTSVIVKITLPDKTRIVVPLFTAVRGGGNPQIMRPDRVTPYFRLNRNHQVQIEYSILYSEDINSNIIETAATYFNFLTSIITPTSLPILSLLGGKDRDEMKKFDDKISDAFSFKRPLNQNSTVRVLGIRQHEECRSAIAGFRLNLTEYSGSDGKERSDIVVTTKLEYIPSVLASFKHSQLTNVGRPDFNHVLTTRDFIDKPVTIGGKSHSDYFSYFNELYYYRDFMEGTFNTPGDQLTACERILQAFKNSFEFSKYDRYAAFHAFLNRNKEVMKSHDLRVAIKLSGNCIEKKEWKELGSYHTKLIFEDKEEEYLAIKLEEEKNKRLNVETESQDQIENENDARSRFENALLSIAKCRKVSGGCNPESKDYSFGTTALYSALADTDEVDDIEQTREIVEAAFDRVSNNSRGIIILTTGPDLVGFFPKDNILRNFDGRGKSGANFAALVTSHAITVLAKMALTIGFICDTKGDLNFGDSQKFFGLEYRFNLRGRIDIIRLVVMENAKQKVVKVSGKIGEKMSTQKRPRKCYFGKIMSKENA